MEIRNVLLPKPTDKRCTKCREWLPNEAFRPNPRLKSGLNSWCRACVVASTQRWRARNPENAENYNQGRRTAYVRKRPTRTPEERRKFRAERERRARATHPERGRAQQARRTERDRAMAAPKRELQARLRATKQIALALNRAYRKADLRDRRKSPEQRRLYAAEYLRRKRADPAWIDRERMRARNAKWGAGGATNIVWEQCAYSKCARWFAHRATIAQHYCQPSHAHRVGKRNWNPVGMTRRQVYVRDGWRCHVCHKKVPDRAYHARDLDPTCDHLIPVTAGGTDHPSNLALAHNKCNWDRGAGGIAQLRLIA